MPTSPMRSLLTPAGRMLALQTPRPQTLPPPTAPERIADRRDMADAAREDAAPPTGTHGHFEMESARGHVVDSWPLRDPGEIAALTSSDQWSYDSAVDAARVVIPAGTSDLWGHIINLEHEVIGPDAGNSVVAVQWEWRLGPNWNDNANHGAVENYKAFRWEYDGASGEDRKWELLCGHLGVDDTLGTICGLRYYGHTFTNALNARPETDLLATWIDRGTTNYDLHPGPDSVYARRDSGSISLSDHPSKWAIATERWYMTTMIWESDPETIRVIMADEEYGPIAIISRDDDANVGFRVDANVPDGGNAVNSFRLLWDTSQDMGHGVAADHTIWVRNVVITADGVPGYDYRPRF